MVATKEECEDAAVFLKLKHTKAIENPFTELQRGCILQRRMMLGWSSLENHQEPRQPCGTTLYGLTFKCICATKGNRLDLKNLKDENIKSSTVKAIIFWKNSTTCNVCS